MMDGVPQQVEHVEAPWIIRKGLHRVGEVPQQMGNTYLVILHPHLCHEVSRKPVSDPYLITPFFPGEVLVDNMMASAAVYISPQKNRAVKNKSYFYNCYGKEEKFYIENQG